jgi:Ca2+-binding EF-hand superfamily protein
MFEEYDKDHSGSLTRDEIKTALAASGVEISVEEL